MIELSEKHLCFSCSQNAVYIICIYNVDCMHIENLIAKKKSNKMTMHKTRVWCMVPKQTKGLHDNFLNNNNSGNG